MLVQVCLQRGRATVRKGNLYVPGGINRDRRNWGRWVGRPNCFLDLVLFGLRQVVRINHVDRLPRVQWVFIRIRLARYQVVTWNRIRGAIWVRYCSCTVIANCNFSASWELILVSIIDVVLNLILFQNLLSDLDL